MHAPDLDRIDLDADHHVFVGTIPDELHLDPAAFDALWDRRPADFHDITIHGRTVKTPRWQQAFGVPYVYSGGRAEASPIPQSLTSFLHWTRDVIEPRVNGLLLNWYEAARGHYIGPHRDSPHQLVVGAPIVTISLGASRIFRMRPWKGRGYTDFRADDGAVFVLPFDTNRAWTHEVPHHRWNRGRRISITLRAFDGSGH